MSTLSRSAVMSSVVTQLDGTSGINCCPSSTLASWICCLNSCLGSCPQVLPSSLSLPSMLPYPAPSPALHLSFPLDPFHQCCCMPVLYVALIGCWGPSGDGTIWSLPLWGSSSVSLFAFWVPTSNSLTRSLLWCLCPLVWRRTRAPRNTSQELKPTSAFQSQAGS